MWFSHLLRVVEEEQYSVIPDYAVLFWLIYSDAFLRDIVALTQPPNPTQQQQQQQQTGLAGQQWGPLQEGTEPAVVGMEGDSVEAAAQKRMRAKLRVIMDDPSHPLCAEPRQLRSTFSHEPQSAWEAPLCRRPIHCKSQLHSHFICILYRYLQSIIVYGTYCWIWCLLIVMALRFNFILDSVSIRLYLTFRYRISILGSNNPAVVTVGITAYQVWFH